MLLYINPFTLSGFCSFINFLKIKSLCAVCYFKVTGLHLLCNIEDIFLDCCPLVQAKLGESTLHEDLCRTVRNIVQ